MIVIAVMLVAAIVTAARRACAIASSPCWPTMTAMAALGAYAIAALNFTLAVLVDHVRLNDYDSRYLTLTQHVRADHRHVDALPGDPLAGRRARGLQARVQPVFALVGIARARDGFPRERYRRAHYRVHR